MSKTEKKNKIRYWGLPLTGTTLVAIILAVAAFVVGLVSLVPAALVDAFFKDPKATLITALVVSFIGTLIVGYLIVNFVCISILEKIHRQALSIFFYIYTVALLLASLFLLVSTFNIATGSSFFFSETIKNGIIAFFSSEIELIREISSSFLGDDPIMMSQLICSACASFIVSTVVLLVVFKDCACPRCKRGFMMVSAGSKVLASNTHAEYKKTSGHWETSKGTISSGLDTATYTVNTYVPGRKEFKGIYRDETVYSAYKCRCCREPKGNVSSFTKKIL